MAVVTVQEAQLRCRQPIESTTFSCPYTICCPHPTEILRVLGLTILGEVCILDAGHDGVRYHYERFEFYVCGPSGHNSAYYVPMRA